MIGSEKRLVAAWVASCSVKSPLMVYPRLVLVADIWPARGFGSEFISAFARLSTNPDPGIGKTSTRKMRGLSCAMQAMLC